MSEMTTSSDLDRTLSWRTYTEPHFLTTEMAAFNAAWHYVGHRGMIPDVGSQYPTRAGRMDLVLVRTDTQTVAAFVNACRHRGATLVAQPRCAQTLICPYHAWTYSLDGQLRSAPRLAAEGIDSLPSDLDLVEIRLEAWGNLLFATLDDQAPPLLEWLGPIPERIERAGIDIDTLQWRQRSEGSLQANWKVIVENYLECYHCQIAHPGFSAVVDVRPGRYEVSAEGSWASQWARRRSDARAVGSSDFDGAGSVVEGQFHYVWPNLIINILPGPPNLSIGPVIPETVALTSRFLDYCIDQDVDDSTLASLIAWDDQVGAEDQVLVEAVQRGMSSVQAGTGAGLDLPTQGVLMPESERLVSWFRDHVEALPAAADR